jgi:uncharacterized protein with HEPN domain
MPRTPEQRINDILERIEQVSEYIDDLTYDGFLANEMIFDAVTYNLEVIGEAASHVPKRVRARYPTIDWQIVVRLREVFRPLNPAGDHLTAWNVIKIELPELKRNLKD